MKPHLVDTNILIALSFQDHALHPRAADWINRLPSQSVGLCRSSQLTYLRLITNPRVTRGTLLSPAQAWAAYDDFRADARFFYLDEPPGIELLFRELTSSERISGSTWTDLYLYAFALAAGLCLATLDEPLLSLGPEVILIP